MSILHQHWSYSLKVNQYLRKVFPKPPMISYTRPTNLRYILVRAQLPPGKKQKDLMRRVRFKRCNLMRCETCPYTKNSTTPASNFTNQSYPITEELSCHTENTFYFKFDVLLLFLHKSYGTPEFPDCGNQVGAD